MKRSRLPSPSKSPNEKPRQSPVSKLGACSMPEVARMSANLSPALFKYTNGPPDTCSLPVGTIRSRKPSLLMSPQIGLPQDVFASGTKPTSAVTSWNCWPTATDERTVTNPAAIARHENSLALTGLMLLVLTPLVKQNNKVLMIRSCGAQGLLDKRECTGSLPSDAYSLSPLPLFERKCFPPTETIVRG